MDRRRLARPRARRQLFPQAMAAGLAARRIQAAARGFLARRRIQRQRRGLMSPADVRAIRRKTQGQVKAGKPGVFPKYRIGSLIGTEKSKRPVKTKMDPLVIKEHVDRFCTIEQPMVAYWGFSDAGAMDDQLRQGCRALINMFFRRSGLKMATITQAIQDSYLQGHDLDSGPWLKRIGIVFQKIMPDGTNDNQVFYIAIDPTDAITNIADELRQLIKDTAADPAAPGGFGSYPVRAILQTFDYDTPNRYEKTFATYDLENVFVDFAYMRKIKWQNVTPADNADIPGQGSERFNLNDVNANPLSGKIYHFKDPAPQLHAQHIDNNDTPNLHQIMKVVVDGTEPGTSLADGWLDTRAFRQGGPLSFNGGLYNAFGQPFRAKEFFKNCVSEDKVYMPPGGYKQLIRQGKVTMNFKRFCQATVTSGNIVQGLYPIQTQPPKKIGGCTIWGLEPAVRTQSNEITRVALNMETWFTTKCRVGNKKIAVATTTGVGQANDFRDTV